MWSKLLKSSFIRSGVIFSIANFVVSMIGYLINLLIARAFSLADYAEYMTAMSYASLLVVPINTFGLIVIQRVGREVGSKRQRVAIELQTWLTKEFAENFYLISTLVVAFVALVYWKGNIGLPAILFIISFTILSLFQSLLSSSLQAFKKFLMAGLFLISIFSIKLFFSILVIKFVPNLNAIFIAFFFATFLGLLVGKRMVYEGFGGNAKTITTNFLQLKKYLKRKNLIVTLMTTFGVIGLSTIDVMLVKKFFPADQAGLYASISLLGKIILYIAAPLSSVAFSFFTGSESRHQAQKILFLLASTYLFIGGISTAGYYLFPDPIISVVFGSKFLAIGNLIWLAAIFGTLYSIIALFSGYLISKNSWLGSFSILALISQIGLLSVGHANLEQVLVINIAVALGLLFVYCGSVINLNFKRS